MTFSYLQHHGLSQLILRLLKGRVHPEITSSACQRFAAAARVAGRALLARHVSRGIRPPCPSQLECVAPPWPVATLPVAATFARIDAQDGIRIA